MHRQTEAAILFRLASFPLQQLIFSVSSPSATRKHALLPEAAGISATNPIPAIPTAFSRTEQAIEETLQNMKQKGNILKKRHTTNLRSELRRIAKNVNIFNPIEVKDFITNKINLPSRNKFEWIYGHFCTTNQLPYDRTHWKYEAPVPIIPTKDEVNTILNSATAKFYTPLKIMATIAVEAEELHQTKRNQINLEARTISILGTKGHTNGTYKLSEELTETLRQYLANHTEEHPFPESRRTSDAWIRYRARRAKQLNKPELLQVKMKNLRNYAGAQQYLHGYTGHPQKDPIATMRFMRHKKLETTLHYIRSINLDEPEEYTTVAIQLGQPDTHNKIMEYANAGYSFFDQADGYKYYRIQK
jgi:integrase